MAGFQILRPCGCMMQAFFLVVKHPTAYNSSQINGIGV